MNFDKTVLCCMSVNNISNLKCISMTIHNVNMISVKYFKNYLADERI